MPCSSGSLASAGRPAHTTIQPHFCTEPNTHVTQACMDCFHLFPPQGPAGHSARGRLITPFPKASSLLGETAVEGQGGPVSEDSINHVSFMSNSAIHGCAGLSLQRSGVDLAHMIPHNRERYTPAFIHVYLLWHSLVLIRTQVLEQCFVP